MRNQILYVLFFLTGVPLTARAQKENIEAALQKLDSVVAMHPENIRKKKAEINKFKRLLETSTSDYNKYEICSHIYHDYMKFDSDSALAYARRGQVLADKMKQKELFVQSKINEMLIMAYRGEYSGVNNIMKLGRTDRKHSVPTSISICCCMSGILHTCGFAKRGR